MTNDSIRGRRVRAIRPAPLIIGALIAAACAGGSDRDGSPSTGPVGASTEVTETSSSPAHMHDGVEHSHDEPDPTTVETTSAVETTDPVSEPAPVLDGPPVEELREAVAAGDLSEVDLAVSEFAAILGVDVDGAQPVSYPDAVELEPTAVVERLRALNEQLTETQRDQINVAVSDVFASVDFTVSNADADDLAEVAESPTIGGIRRTPAPARTLTDEALRDLVVQAEAFVMGQLEGVVPIYAFGTIAPEDRTARQRTWRGWASTSEIPETGKRLCRVIIVDFPGRSLEGVLSTVIHEFFHCWHGANFPGTIDEYHAAPKWIKEGLATWVADQAIDVGVGESWARTWLARDTGRLFPSEYSALGFFWQINALDGSNEQLWSRIDAITAAGDHATGYAAATAGLSGVELALFAASGSRDPDFGAEWTFDVEGRDVGDGRPIDERSVGAVAADFVRAGERRIVDYTFTSADGGPIVIDLKVAGLTAVGWHGDELGRTDVGDRSVTAWCAFGECVCDDGRIPAPDIRPVPGDVPVVRVALTGSGVEGASVDVGVTSLADACAEEPSGDGPVGVWVAEPAAVVAAYAEAYAEIGLTVTGASGEVTMTLYEDQTVEIRYDDVRLGLSDPFVDEVIISGVGTEKWSVSGDTLSFAGPSDFSISVVTPAVSPDPLTVTDEDIGVGENTGVVTTTYSVDGATLALGGLSGSRTELPDGTTGVLVYPLEWRRLGDAPPR